MSKVISPIHIALHVARERSSFEPFAVGVELQVFYGPAGGTSSAAAASTRPETGASIVCDRLVIRATTCDGLRLG